MYIYSATASEVHSAQAHNVQKHTFCFKSIKLTPRLLKCATLTHMCLTSHTLYTLHTSAFHASKLTEESKGKHIHTHKHTHTCASRHTLFTRFTHPDKNKSKGKARTKHTYHSP